ncbi:hypothetical protein SALBM135S_07199 [Streptomyces alboniger]
MRRRIAERMTARIRPEAWVIDDVSFLKDSRMSVAVAPQYCGALDKRANCPIAVSVHACTATASCPLQWRLFLPEEWAEDAERRAACKVPADIGHREKWRLALDILVDLTDWGLRPASRLPKQPMEPTRPSAAHSPSAASPTSCPSAPT